MRRVRLAAAVIALLCTLMARGLVADAQAGAVPGVVNSSVAAVTFSFDRPGLDVAKYTLTIREDGIGRYAGDESIAVRSGGPATVPAPAQHFDRAIVISHATVAKVFAMAHELNDFNTVCASKAKNIADTGKKVLAYKGSEGGGSCGYNYSDNKDVQQLTALFQSLAGTMDQGRALDHMHRYDRLGLDAAMTYLTQQVTDGRVLELENIAPSLQAIAADADLIERVRKKASTLLLSIPAQAEQARSQ